jgi:hypothetical protein
MTVERFLGVLPDRDLAGRQVVQLDQAAWGAHHPPGRRGVQRQCQG